MSPKPSKDQVPAGFDWSACPLPSQPKDELRKAEDPYDALAEKVARNVAVSGFDFDAPEWLRGDFPCPVFPGDAPQGLPPRRIDEIRCEVTSELDLWLAEQGYVKESKPGYLGLTLLPAGMAVSREGYPEPVRLGKRHFKLLCVIYRAKSDGIEPHKVQKVLRGTPAALGVAVSELRTKLGILNITVSKRRWKLVEEKRKKSAT
ncbi:MAG: hypothetical protein GXY83_18820 [Rhodopirellula sp.]|nr:hypothetical protein [Rhodopirellula sp.]